jgi:hypothetical protein
MSKDTSFRPGGKKYNTLHRAWLHPDQSLPVDTRRTHCHKCLRPKNHPIHWKVFRENQDWDGWKNVPDNYFDENYFENKKDFNLTYQEKNMSRKSLQNQVDEIYEDYDDEDELSEALQDANIGEKVFDSSNTNKIVAFLFRCMDCKVDVVEAPSSGGSQIQFHFQKKAKAPEGPHCGNCKSTKDLRSIEDQNLRQELKLETSTYACLDCIEAYWDE